jgi:hypothetical protein
LFHSIGHSFGVKSTPRDSAIDKATTKPRVIIIAIDIENGKRK